jgi:hypothetical protein
MPVASFVSGLLSTQLQLGERSATPVESSQQIKSRRARVSLPHFRNGRMETDTSNGTPFILLKNGFIPVVNH